ncbi:MAG: hypothetical protein JST23_11490 [Bacteroidetes bacterium]|nr:hypothetical protein [Bacteroidota bacterium]
MKKTIYNDQAYIAESYILNENFTNQTARLTVFKINSYKLSKVCSSFCKTKDELEVNLKNNLFNYTCPAIILADLGFFKSEFEN